MKKLLKLLSYLFLIVPLFTYLASNAHAKKNDNPLPQDKVDLFNEFNWNLLEVDYKVNLKEHTKYLLKDKKTGKEFYIFTNDDFKLSKENVSRILPLKILVDNLSSVTKKEISYFIDSREILTATIIPSRWDYSNVQFQEYIPSGIVFVLQNDSPFYSFRLVKDDKSALVYGSYLKEALFNQEVYRTLLINFGIPSGLYDNKIGSSINLWVGTGTLAALSYEMQVYKGFHIGFMTGFTANIDQTINTISLIQGSGTSLQAGIRFSYYFVNMSALTPYMFISNLNSISLKELTYHNIFQLGFGILISTWFYVEGSYNLNTLTGVNNASIGIGFRIPIT